MVALDSSTGSRRHGRHRRDPEPVVIGTNSVFEAVEEQQENKHKPKFEHCDDYVPQVEEQADRGTRVIRVYATDGDGSGPSGQVTYSVVSTHNKFTIDANTGWLSTNAIFNRDEPDREKLVHVTVKASDNGRPQLEDVCTLAVKVKDINDNSPVFDRANYDVPVAQDTPVGTQIMRVSATDVDEGENQKISYDLVATRIPNDLEYFEWHWKTGVVTLQRKLDKPIGYIFELKATASDSGNPSKSTVIDVTLEVRESDKKPPSFVHGPGSEITLEEGYNRFSEPIARYTAKSNIPGDETVFFQLLSGRTEKTNQDGTFRAVQNQDDPKAVSIYLAKALEFEKVSEYTLTLQVRNSPDLEAEAQLTVKIQDENNQAPIFTNVESGNVLEHEPAGTIVMQVSAVDNDGTYPNNRVSYYISMRNPASILEKFEINPDSGEIKTRKEFDREEQAVYALTVDAKDGAPSSLLQNGKPNVTPQKFRIAIADKNDNPPYFPQQLYMAEVPEDQDVDSKVIEVRAKDKDTEASITTYQIIKGDPGKAFKIEEQTGFIRVAKPLDYEGIKKYNLVVGAWDGQFGSETNVEIKILNVNDMRPKFSKDRYTIDEVEEREPKYPIFQVIATDPDIADTSVPQNITYYLDHKSQNAKHFSIDERTGDIRIVKKLNRDLPDGYPTWSTYIFAKDENGGPTGIESAVEFIVNLVDINDNAPFLDMPDGLVWSENQGPGEVGSLKADDYDTVENGPPFKYSIETSIAPQDIKSSFRISEPAPNNFVLEALVAFDREKKKRYDIPVKVCDHKDLCAVSTLFLTVGDVNDNPMKPGFSEVFVYNYEGQAPDTQIGRVYVNDPDDWDLPDKTFRFRNPLQWGRSFGLDSNTGMITMKKGIPLPEEVNTYSIDFLVEDPIHGQINRNAVSATVNVTIQRIPKVAVVKSGSIRLLGSPEDFVKTDSDGVSKRDRFRKQMSRYLNATHVDVFTVLPSKGGKYTDVRFSAHGSPYYEPEKLEGVLAKRKMDLSRALNVEIAMIRIDECMDEINGKCSGGSCANELRIENQPVTIYTNTTSFVGVQARVVPFCGCVAPRPMSRSCTPNPCLNNGTCEHLSDGSYQCQCPANNPEYFGPNCERLAASFNGHGWSWHKGIPACGNSHFSMIFNTGQPEGTLLYTGPSPNNIVPNVTDFMAIELKKGKVNMYINFGSGTKLLTLEQRVDDNKDHYLAVRWTNDTVQMELDDKTCSNEISSPRHNCFIQITTHEGTNHYLNTNGPLHVGGVSFGQGRFQDLADAIGLNRVEMPNGNGFAGCIKNLTFSAAGNTALYNLGSPSDGENYTPGCDEEFVQAVIALNLNMNFLIAILVCLAIILVAVIVLAVYRRKRHVFSDKDIDCDIRENIINYEDEGGGEGDQTGYDLSVLRMMSDGTPALHGGMDHLKIPPEPAPDIQTFLQNNKERIDGDPDATPYDDLRHYAYEGDGNSGGSLSSLNSGTSDGDLEFDYLHNFGPRFKKLADMYGEEPDSEDDEPLPMPPPPAPPSESWC